MPKLVVRMELARYTKNTYRFEELERPDGALRVLYIQHSAFPGGPPKAINVTIDEAE